jgi:hypothetical protein
MVAFRLAVKDYFYRVWLFGVRRVDSCQQIVILLAVDEIFQRKHEQATA